jgi:hypothetical protein
MNANRFLGSTTLKSAAALGVGLAILLAPMAAYAGSSAPGIDSATITAASLAVSSVGSMTALTPVAGATATGALPTAQWVDATGSGAGWNGTVAVSPLSYTGAWVKSAGATSLTSTAAGTFSGNDNGKHYTVTVTGTPAANSTPFSWTSDVAGDSAGGTGLATTATVAVGTKGVTVTFDTAVVYALGGSYTVLVGTQSASALQLNTATAPAVTATGTTSASPTYAGNSSTLAGGTTVGSVNSAGAVKFLTASAGTGATGTSGYYTAGPGIEITADGTSWAQTYSGSLTYSIITGP